MTFDPSKPNAADSPSLFPSENQTNMGRLQTLLGADHQFNVSAAGNDGYHKVARWVTQAGAFGDNTPAPIAGNGQLYTKSASGTEHLFYHQGTGGAAGNEACLSFAPVRAFANFSVALPRPGGAASIVNGFNVSSITLITAGTSAYQINFSVALPSANYVVCGTGMDQGTTQQVMLSIYADGTGTYANSATTSFVRVSFTNGSAYAGIVRGMIVVLGG